MPGKLSKYSDISSTIPMVTVTTVQGMSDISQMIIGIREAPSRAYRTKGLFGSSPKTVAVTFGIVHTLDSLTL